MQLKRRNEIKPTDLPYIESAFFAVSKLNRSRHDTFKAFEIWMKSCATAMGFPLRTGGKKSSDGSPAAYWRMKGGFDQPGDTPGGEGGFMSYLRNQIKTFKCKPLGTVGAWVLGTDDTHEQQTTP